MTNLYGGDEPPKELVMCGVCKLPLDYLRTPMGWIPVHVGEVYGTLKGEGKHRSVPVPYDHAIVRVKCDFCGEMTTFPLTTTVVAESFVVPMINHTSSGCWAACPACSPFLYAGDWDGLMERAIEHYPTDPGGDTTFKTLVVRPWLEATYAMLRKRTTDIRPYRLGDEDPYTQPPEGGPTTLQAR